MTMVKVESTSLEGPAKATTGDESNSSSNTSNSKYESAASGTTHTVS